MVSEIFPPIFIAEVSDNQGALQVVEMPEFTGFFSHFRRLRRRRKSRRRKKLDFFYQKANNNSCKTIRESLHSLVCA
jgi:hypothetical protein